MAKNPEAFAVNDRVLHATYGPGTIVEVGPLRTIIEFDTNGRRKFMTSLVQLERSDVAAPAAPSKRSRAKKPAAKPAAKTGTGS